MKSIISTVGLIGGWVLILMPIFAYVFREYIKASISKYMSADLARLNSDLIKKQQEHAASLLPELEKIRHEFAQKMEAYKVSLIAEAELVKAKSELRKNIAMKYSEYEFDRLVALESVLSTIAIKTIARASIRTESKINEHYIEANEILIKLEICCKEIEMYLNAEEIRGLTIFQGHLFHLANSYIGNGKSAFDTESELCQEILRCSYQSTSIIRDRIRSLAVFT